MGVWLEEGDDNAVTATTKDVFDKLKRKGVVNKAGEKIDPESGEILKMTKHSTKADPLEGAATMYAMLKKSKI